MSCSVTMSKARRVLVLSEAQIARLAELAVSPEWLTFTVISCGGAEFVSNLGIADGEGVIFVRESTIFESSGD